LYGNIIILVTKHRNILIASGISSIRGISNKFTIMAMARMADVGADTDNIMNNIHPNIVTKDEIAKSVCCAFPIVPYIMVNER